MLSFISLALILATSAPAAVEAALGKPVWSTNGLSPLDNYYSTIPRLSSSRVSIAAPSMCVSRASGKCAASDIQAVRVTYSDCATPWVLCRCSNANMRCVEIQCTADRL